MKIYVLPVADILQPKSQPFRYPRHNADYGVEQDFLNYLTGNNLLITTNQKCADWHYLPVYWTRWHLNRDYGRHGVEQLQREVSAVVVDDAKTFTICQYDDGPKVNLGRTVVFLAARRGNVGIDVPVLCAPHHPWFIIEPKKRYLASFVGRLSSHPIRTQMAQCLTGHPQVFLYDGEKSTRYFLRKMLESYTALCPRGYGGTSFRFFEAMQLGVAPFFIGEPDTRPFKKFIDWDQCSLYAREATFLHGYLESLDIERLVAMGHKAAQVYQEDLCFGKWCRYVIRELEELGQS